MIKLTNDQLTFQFPALESQLRELGKEHCRAAVTHILGEDRNLALRKLRARSRYDLASPVERARAERRMLEVSDREISAIVESLTDRILSDYLLTELTVGFQRTLRIPDNSHTYPLPAGLGLFPLRDIDDFAKELPPTWVERGGVLMPMYQSEALWIYFDSVYPCAVKVAAGKINAVTGKNWSEGLTASPQNYVVTPEQPWLDGFAVGKGVIRQFVAMPLGSGYSVEEQLTGKAEVGGLQLQVYPMKPETCFRKLIQMHLPQTLSDLIDELTDDILPMIQYCRTPQAPFSNLICEEVSPCMGLAAGGKMRQEIYADPYGIEDWDTQQSPRCFVHICNSMQWRQITRSDPPHPPLTANEYQRYGIPWFDYYRDDLQAINGSESLKSVKSVAQMSALKKDGLLPGNWEAEPQLIIQHGNKRRPTDIREYVN
jgi:hypothetical protein